MERKFKIVVVGHTGVGKTSILHRYISEDNDMSSLEPTLGAVFHEKVHQLQDGEKVNFEIWDTAGQQRYRSIAKIYYKDAKVVLAVFDVTSRASFEEMKHWIQEVRTNTNKTAKIVVVGNKTDLINSSELSKEQFADMEQAKALAQSLGSSLKLTSAQDNEGIIELFTIVGQKATQAVQQIKKEKQETKVRIEQVRNQSNEQRKKGCCV